MMSLSENEISSPKKGIVWKRGWRKVLYEKQSCPDNYIDREKFFDQLNTDVSHTSQPSYVSLVQSATVVAHQFSLMVIFLTIYKYGVADRISKYGLLTVDLLCFLIPSSIARYLDREYFNTLRNPIESIRRVFIAGVVLRVSAPILQTLTSSFSANTVHSLAFIMSTVHLITFDYNFKGNEDNVGSLLATMSLNAAVFTAVLLASRLKDIDTVVCFILFAAVIFAILPGLLRHIREQSLWWHIWITIGLWVIATLLLLFFNFTLFVVYEVLIVFLWLLCPWWYLLLSAHKKSLRGPWEEAVVAISMTS